MMPRLKLTYLAALSALLPACALVGPDYQRPEMDMPAQYGTTQDTQNSTAEISSTWWELYQDPVLNDLVAKTLQNNVDIQIAVARVEEADAFLREVGSALFPTVDLRLHDARHGPAATGSLRSTVKAREGAPPRGSHP